MVRLLLGLILFYIVVRAILRFVRGVAQGLREPEAQPRAIGLVRDPVCGTFVVPSRALTAGSGADVHFFCSERCREAWSRR
jgi:YHS domain-containing protein